MTDLMTNQETGFPRRKLLTFVVLSLVDFMLTWYLLTQSGGHVYESNPVAQWWLVHFGWVGLAGFKAAAMSLAAGLGIYLFLRRPAVGHRVLGFGCAALVTVVVYSGYLIQTVHASASDPDDDIAFLAGRAKQIEESFRVGDSYRKEMEETSAALLAGNSTLTEAVVRIRNTRKAQDPEWYQQLSRHYPSLHHIEAQLAANILLHISNQVSREPHLGKRMNQLLKEFSVLYGVPFPLIYPGIHEVTPPVRVATVRHR